MSGKLNKELADARTRSQTNGRLFEEVNNKAQRFLRGFKDIKVVEVKQCATPETRNRSFIVSYTTVGFEGALTVIGNVKPDLILVDGDDAGDNLDAFLKSLQTTTVPRLLIISRDGADVDGVKHLVDHIAFKPVKTEELVRIAYHSKQED